MLRYLRLYGFARADRDLARLYAVIAEATGRFAVAAAGVLFGLGYSVAYPVLSVWVAEQFEPRQRTTPIALFNTMFSAGILTPWFGNMSSVSWGIAGCSTFLRRRDSR